jgi:hypothetical protein
VGKGGSHKAQEDRRELTPPDPRRQAAGTPEKALGSVGWGGEGSDSAGQNTDAGGPKPVFGVPVETRAPGSPRGQRARAAGGRGAPELPGGPDAGVPEVGPDPRVRAESGQYPAGPLRPYLSV